MTNDIAYDINDILNDELVQINNWLKVNKLSVNVAKTKAMIFHMPQKQIHNPRLTIAGSNIEFIDNFNFLGITINKHLNWTKHMDTLSAKIAKTVGILNTLKHVLPTNILKMIYNSLILCHLNYGILLWGAQHNANDKLHKLQKKAIRIITSSNFLAHSEPIFKQFSPSSHLEGSSTSVGRPGHCQSPVLAVENVDVRQRILFDVPPDGVHVS